jgi:membrane protease YdiL (CAAX protease family)
MSLIADRPPDDLPLRPTAQTLAALLVALAGPPLLVIVSRRTFGEFPSVGVQLVLQLVLCAFAGVVLYVVIHSERLPLSSIGLRRPGRSTVISGLLVGLCILYLLPLVTAPLIRVLDLGGFERGLEKLVRLPVWFRVFVAVTGGTVEETLYRGYAVERLAAITGRCWLGGLIAAIAFGLAHIPSWGIGPALGADLPLGAVMTVFYLWKRDLAANSLAHSTALFVGLLSMPAAARGRI